MKRTKRTSETKHGQESKSPDSEGCRLGRICRIDIIFDKGICTIPGNLSLSHQGPVLAMV